MSSALQGLQNYYLGLVRASEARTDEAAKKENEQFAAGGSEEPRGSEDDKRQGRELWKSPTEVTYTYTYRVIYYQFARVVLCYNPQMTCLVVFFTFRYVEDSRKLDLPGGAKSHFCRLEGPTSVGEGWSPSWFGRASERPLDFGFKDSGVQTYFQSKGQRIKEGLGIDVKDLKRCGSMSP